MNESSALACSKVLEIEAQKDGGSDKEGASRSEKKPPYGVSRWRRQGRVDEAGGEDGHAQHRQGKACAT